jgi:tetratricopeptide (TPR) repeat protein
LILAAALIFFKKHRKELLFGFGFYLSTIVLIIQLFPMGSAVVSERYSYVPYIGLSIMLLRILFIEAEQSKNVRLNTKLILYGASFYILFFAYQSFQRTKAWTSPETLFSDIVDKKPDAYYAYWLRSTARLNANNYEDCITDCSKGLKLNPSYTKFYSVRGLAFYNIKDYKHAIQDLNNYLTNKADDGEIYFTRAKCKRELQDYTGTIEDYEKALRLNSRLKTAVVYIDLSNLKLEMQDIEGSNKELDNALALDSKNVDAFFNKAVNYFNLHQYKAAIDYFNKAIAINPNDNELYYNRSLAKSVSGDKNGACQDLRLSASLGNVAAKKDALLCK